MIKLICYPKCTTCQKAKQWLDDRQIEYEYRDIKLNPPTRNELTEWYRMSGLPLKKFFNTKAGKTEGISRYMPQIKTSTDIFFEIISKAIMPSEEECKQNSRARSAKLRYAIRAKGVKND